MDQEKPMIEKKTWEDFREQGLLWWINTILHLLGWAIVVDIDKGVIVEVYPARVRFRGFGLKDTEDGYRKVTAFMKENAEQLLEEANE